MANKFDMPIAKLSSKNFESKVMEHDVGFKVANSETSYLFIGPHSFDPDKALDPKFIANALKTFSYEFLLDPMYNNNWGPKSDGALVKYVDSSAFEVATAKMKATYSIVGLTQQANLNITPGVNPMTFVGSKHKYFSDLEFMSSYAMSIVKPKFYGSNFLQTIIMNLGLQDNTYVELQDAVSEVEDADGNVITEAAPEIAAHWETSAIALNTLKESFGDFEDSADLDLVRLFKYIYRKLVNFDTHSMAYKMPFGLGLILTSKNGEILGTPYLENCHVQTFGSSMRLDQPIVVDQMQFIGGSMESISNPNNLL